MKYKRKILKNKTKHLLFLNAFLVLLLFIGLGYSVLSTNLNISGNVELKEYMQPTLYNVFRKEAEIGTYAKEYTGNHNDSIDTSLSTEKIYHWYAPSATEGNEILEKNNVIFASKCWQMIRTTDTGGVKMIYNGTSSDGKCNNTKTGQQIGTSKFNNSNYQLSKVGYLINNDYTFDQESFPASFNYSAREGMISKTDLSIYRWYADSVSYSNGNYTLVNPYKITSQDFPNMVGKYTLESSDATYSTSKAYYIVEVNASSSYRKELNNGELTLNSLNITFGESVTKISENNYVLSDTTTIPLADWYNNYSSYANKYTCGSDVTSCSAPRLITSAYSSYYNYIDLTQKILLAKTRNGLNLSDTVEVYIKDLAANYSNYTSYKYTCNNLSSTCTEENLRYIDSIYASYFKYSPNRYYGTSVTWNGSNYTLQNTVDLENYRNTTTLSTHHYICLEYGKKTCSTIAYIYYYNTGSGGDIHYTILDNGVTSITDAMNTMLSGNTDNSTIKSSVDSFYSTNLLAYDDQIEDVIYCNNRSIRTIAGWNPDGGSATASAIYFGPTTITGNLSCSNVTDQLSVSNNQAKLTYKIALLTAEEAKLIGNSTILKTGEYYWLRTPSGMINRSGYKYSDTYGYYINNNGAYDNALDTSTTHNGYDNSMGVRPVISLKPGIKFVSGDGSKNNPYVVENPS